MGRVAWLRGARIANTHKTVTPSDTEDNTTALPGTTVALYVGGAGNVNAEMWGDTTELVYSSVPAGTYLEGNFRFVKSTSTTATNIRALYVT